jgi:hypothetical protein
MINHPLTGNPDQSFDDYSAQHFVPKAHKAVSAVSEHVVHDPQRDLTDMPNGGAQHLRPTADNHSLDHDETISPPKTAVISPTGASQNQPILNDSLGQNSDMSTHFDSTTPPIQSAPVEYVLTVHKAQGSQAKRVILFEERFQKMTDDEWKRWLYTAVTRAEEELYIFGRDPSAGSDSIENARFTT